MNAHSDTDRDDSSQREALRALHRDVLDEPVPVALLAAASSAARRQGQRARWLGWSGIAAAVLIAFGIGWIANGQWTLQRTGAALAQTPGNRAFAHEAAVAHAVFSPEKRHPVEVAAAEQQHLVQWLSRRLDRPLKVPDLSAEGYALVGGRLLPGDDGVRAQFMFEDPAGRRVTLYLGAVGDKAAPSTAHESAFRFSSQGPVPSFYWVDRGFGYALAGDASRELLLRLAISVYRQL
jgi:anti-sigma factor RsiW